MSDRLKLGDIADMAKDMYFRNYRPDDAFFDANHFKFLIVTLHTTLINDDFDLKKREAKRTDGFSYVELSGPWLLTDDVEIKDEDGTNKKYVETKHPVFAFGFDSVSQSIHSIIKGGECPCNGDVIRFSNKDEWKIPYLPKTSDIYFYMIGEKIYLYSWKDCGKKFKVRYIPMLTMDDDECVLPEIYASKLIVTTLETMFGAKKETMGVDKNNNSNDNDIK